MAVERLAIAAAAICLRRLVGTDCLRLTWMAVGLGLVMAGCGGGSSSPPPPSNLAYPDAAIHGTVGQAISPDSPTVNGNVTSYSVSPALPSGLALNASSGVISGTPKASSPQAAYTVIAQNQAGSTSATVNVTVTVPAPSGLAYPQTTIAAIAGQPVMPEVPVVNGTELMFGVNPALPAGLSLDSATGILSGTPTASAAQGSFTVTAQNSGGSSTASINVSVLAAQNSLVDLGHANSIQAIRMVAGRVLSVDQPGHWVLWDYNSDALLAEGDGSPNQLSAETVVVTLKQIDMAGTAFVVGIPNGLEVFSTADGHLVTIIPYAGIGQLPSGGTVPWWQLASDGSYITIGSASGLSVYSAAGQLLASKAGDYSSAQSFSAPGSVQVALGPAGASVIETISVADGSSTVSPSFSGQFHSWFVDGSRFLTNQQTTVWVYSNTGTQQAIVSVPSIDTLSGVGKWIVSYGSNTFGYPLAIYAIGSATPALTWTGNASTTAVASSNTFGVLSYGAGQVSVFDLSGSTPSRTDYSDPIAYLTTYASDSNGHWVIGNEHGALVDGASLTATPRFLGYGQAWSIAGSSSVAALSTASGRIPVIDPSASALQQTIDFSSSKVSLSSDGTMLGAMADANDSQYEPDRTLNFYALPAGSVVKSYPYTYQDSAPFQPFLSDFTLSGSAGTIAQTLLSLQTPISKWTRNITPLSGSPVIWSDSPVAAGTNGLLGPAPILLSPDGTLADVYSGGNGASYATNIFKNGTLVTAIQGVAIGWIDNNRLLVNQYANTSTGTQFSGAVIYDATGAKVAATALPELKSIQTVTSDSVYDASHNAIYSLTTGQPTWTATYAGSGLGAVAGAYVVYESGHSIIAETY